MCQRKRERVVVVIQSLMCCVVPSDLVLIEDLFGADDADWAIYRKIVST